MIQYSDAEMDAMGRTHTYTEDDAKKIILQTIERHRIPKDIAMAAMADIMERNVTFGPDIGADGEIWL